MFNKMKPADSMAQLLAQSPNAAEAVKPLEKKHYGDASAQIEAVIRGAVVAPEASVYAKRQFVHNGSLESGSLGLVTSESATHEHKSSIKLCKKTGVSFEQKRVHLGGL
jgi:hypothetical protein